MVSGGAGADGTWSKEKVLLHVIISTTLVSYVVVKYVGYLPDRGGHPGVLSAICTYQIGWRCGMAKVRLAQMETEKEKELIERKPVLLHDISPMNSGTP